MYHRFQRRHDSHVERVTYISGDTWNTNPSRSAGRRLSARTNGRCCGRASKPAATSSTLRAGGVDPWSPASDLPLSGRAAAPATPWPNVIHCGAGLDSQGRGDGWFELGSTIGWFAPKGFALSVGVAAGEGWIRVGQGHCFRVAFIDSERSRSVRAVVVLLVGGEKRSLRPSGPAPGAAEDVVVRRANVRCRMLARVRSREHRTARRHARMSARRSRR